MPQNSTVSEGSDNVWLDVDELDELGAVVLNVYDVTQQRAIEAFNNATYILGAGAYHVGIEVHGQEWSYGGGDKGTGVMQAEPRCHSLHRYRGAVRLGVTAYTKEEVTQIIFQLAGGWLAIDYNVFSKNCVHFAQAFVARLGVEDLPDWVGRLTRVLGRFVSPIGSSFACSRTQCTQKHPALEEGLIEGQGNQARFVVPCCCCKSELPQSCNLSVTPRTSSATSVDVGCETNAPLKYERSRSSSPCRLYAVRYVPTPGERLLELRSPESRSPRLSSSSKMSWQEGPPHVKPMGDAVLPDDAEIILGGAWV